MRFTNDCSARRIRIRTYLTEQTTREEERRNEVKTYSKTLLIRGPKARIEKGKKEEKKKVQPAFTHTDSQAKY
jgi:hypothetical protein